MNFANYCKYIVHSFKEILCLRIIDFLFFYLRSSILWGLLFTTLTVFYHIVQYKWKFIFSIF
jgi:hypothetical protein